MKERVVDANVNVDIHPALTGSLTPPETTPQVKNFSPGPTCLPSAVESEIRKQCFDSRRISSMFLSHRSPEFGSILKSAVELIRKVMSVPDNYEVLFTHGGGHGQFAAVPLNLCPNGNEKATYLVNGTWSERAFEEAKKFCDPVLISSKQPDGTCTSLPQIDQHGCNQIDPQSKYVYLCSNETVFGLEYFRLPKNSKVPLVIDASSDFSTKPIDWVESNVGIVYACASKNIGHPGVTLTIVRKDLLGNPSSKCPGVFDYTVNVKGNNTWNTTATFNVDVVRIVMDWILQNGGVHEMERMSIRKSKMLYDAIDESNGFFSTPVSNTSIRSRMNVPFDVAGGDKELTDKFLIACWEKGMVGLRTMTPFGVGKYLRASLYHGVPQEYVADLASFMTEFAEKNRHRCLQPLPMKAKVHKEEWKDEDLSVSQPASSTSQSSFMSSEQSSLGSSDCFEDKEDPEENENRSCTYEVLVNKMPFFSLRPKLSSRADGSGK